MPVVLNLRHLEAHPVTLEGELPVAELDLNLRDDVIAANQPLHFVLEAQRLDEAVLLQGRVRITLDCQCVRCLKPFPRCLELNPWTLHLPLEGEDKVLAVNDCVDLTPYLREDILLEFPQHPLCKADCRGLAKASSGAATTPGDADASKGKPSAWAELDKLKF